ncbi:MAG: 2-oxo acid dehydrogenase subunit E2 [Peptococcaceae bacterium]|nr:2-oxo acid dehydrogenase subunit E2 [Peptococcaceae bacterium]
MAEWIIMPKQGLQMTEGTITTWFIEEGGHIEAGADLFEMETDKLTIRIPASEGGTLLKILHPAGDTVPITKPIAIIGASGEDIAMMLASVEKGAVTPQFATPRAKMTAEQQGIPYQEVPGSGPDGLVIERDVLGYSLAASVRATPLARKLASIEDVDLVSVSGTGSHSKIMAADVRRAARRNRQSSVRGEKVIPLTGMRKVVSSRMKGSLLDMAQATHRITVDMTESVRLRDMLKEVEIKVSYNDIVLRCVARALSEFPMMNSSWSDTGIIQKEYVNLGVAVAVSDGLLVPVIKDADLLTLQELSACSSELAVKAKENRVTSEECSGGTFTVSNLGMFDIDSFTAIINPPEAGILAVGKLSRQPSVIKDEIVIRPMMQLSLTYDHRIVDGAPAAMFLRRIKELLENPGLLL